MCIAHNEQGDVLRVEFRARIGAGQSREDPGDCFVEYDDAGPRGVDFLHTSDGIDLDGMPEADASAEAPGSLSILLGHAVRPARA